MKKSTKFSPEVRERAIRMVQEHCGQYPSLWAAVGSIRQRRDAALVPEVKRVWQTKLCVYGVDTVWQQLRRERFMVARCTVERLMRGQGLRGVIRGKNVRNTAPDAKAACPLDHVNRVVKAERPKQLWVSDFSDVSTWQGFLYVAFVIDLFARRIVGWRVSSSMKSDVVLGRAGRAGDLGRNLAMRESGR